MDIVTKFGKQRDIGLPEVVRTLTRNRPTTLDKVKDGNLGVFSGYVSCFEFFTVLA